MANVRKRSDGLATSERLITEAAKEIQRFGVDGFDVQRVMTKAQATNGSLYHHFGSKSGLIAAAEIQQLVKHLEEDNFVFRDFVEKCRSKSEFVTILERMIDLVAASRSDIRGWRVRAFALALDNKAVAKIVRTAQVEQTQFASETLRIAKDRGYISTNCDTEAVSYWMQGQFFGFILLENGDTERLRADWKKTSLAGLKGALGI